ncbi:MAG: UDP-2,3-diacylglucosamine diphosphatase [Bacteroidales bacterium]|nr:UDP-2,3-diacylglucosamine diphosphatase [Bacteroidales bacterium]
MTSPGERKNIYFASDFHFGIPDHAGSLVREKLFVKWLDEVKKDASHIYLMGDIFDFWFEYKTVVPKGFVRLLGKLAEITDAGIPISLFRGNHDVWAFNYFEKELNIKLYRKPEIMEFSGKKFYLAHGDGLGPGDRGYKFLKKVFACRFNQWLFRWLHPDMGARMGLYFSKKSRLANIAREGKKDSSNNIKDEMLYKYGEDILKQHPDLDYLIFGHRHLPVQVDLNDKTQLIILGDWITNFTYAVFDGEELRLLQFGREAGY